MSGWDELKPTSPASRPRSLRELRREDHGAAGMADKMIKTLAGLAFFKP
jgi:hypothetical protein